MVDRHLLIFPRLFDSRGRRILEISVYVENVPGMMAKIAKRLAEEGVNILSGVHHECPEAEDAEKGWWCFFVECDGSISAERLQEMLGELQGVIEVLVSEANVGRLAVDRHHSLQFIGVDRVIQFRVSWIAGIFREIYRRWGDDGRRMVYLEGFYGGRRSYHVWRERLGMDGRELFEVALELWPLLGWAERAQLHELDTETGEATVRIWGSFEAVERDVKPTCHFMLGVVTGFLSEMAREPLYGIETKCQAVGDEYCEFVVRKKPFVFPE